MPPTASTSGSEAGKPATGTGGVSPSLAPKSPADATIESPSIVAPVKIRCIARFERSVPGVFSSSPKLCEMIAPG